jgi:hypothetical protein
MSEAAKEIRFIVQILESLGIVVQKPKIFHVDNIGAIFISENASATSRTRHVGARYHFVREFVEEGFLKIIFVKTSQNKSDMFAKNVSGDLYQSHVDEYISPLIHLVYRRKGVGIYNTNTGVKLVKYFRNVVELAERLK